MSEVRTGSDSENTAAITQLAENKSNAPDNDVPKKPSEPSSSRKKKGEKGSKKDKRDGNDSSSSGASLAPTHLPGMRFSGIPIS
ncbi:hypothetical protein SLS62_000539 [Diatrype stigma]|uniref:Uncharacterized protein n=1 Tax=Diatrype stigma TaxID=117547 RepID=A0AAN9UXQ6_9PEZI